MVSQQRRALLHSIVSLGDQLSELLDSQCDSSPVEPLCQGESTHADVVFATYEDRIRDLKQQLSSRPLAASALSRLETIFGEAADLWQTKLRHGAVSLFSKLSALGGSTVHQRKLLTAAIGTEYSSGLERLVRGLLQSVDDSLASFHHQIESTTYDLHDTGIVGRGHRPEAIAILERAYTHTNNITQAEKNRLAQLTGLEPRQVVIW